MGIAAKDQSNFLVAGSLRIFPQDSREMFFYYELDRVKRMISDVGRVNLSVDSQTLNRSEGCDVS